MGNSSPDRLARRRAASSCNASKLSPADYFFQSFMHVITCIVIVSVHVCHISHVFACQTARR